jgi:hypothetical protein
VSRLPLRVRLARWLVGRKWIVVRHRGPLLREFRHAYDDADTSPDWKPSTGRERFGYYEKPPEVKRG